MNNLSWMIYFADVCTNLGWVLGTVTVVLLITVVVLSVLSMMMTDEDDFPHARLWRLILGWGVMGVLFGVLTILVPSQKTVYLIAASQAGEVMARMPEAQVMGREVYDAILSGLRGVTKKDAR